MPSLDDDLGAEAALRHGVVARDQAGLTPGFVRARREAGRWIRQGPRAYVINGAPPSWLQDLHAALANAGPDSAISHRSAALLHDLGRFRPIVELTTPRKRRYRAGDAVVHTSTRFTDVDVCYLGALAATSVDRTLIDLGAVVPRYQVEEALEVAIRDGLTSLASLEGRLRQLRGPGRRGAGVIADLLGTRRRGPAPESPPESRFLRIVEDSALPTPRPQFVIREAGKVLGRVDAAWPDWHLAVEIDSHAWHSTRKQRQHDAARENRIKLAGWQVLRFTTDDIWDQPHLVVSTLRRALGLGL